MSTPRDVSKELIEYLRELHLPAIRNCLQEKARQAEHYERGSVLITSTLPFSKWEAIFKDP